MTPASCGTLTALTLGLPAATAVPAQKGTLPKQMFIAKGPVSSSLKKRFTNDVASIAMLALLRPINTDTVPGRRMAEILVLGVELNCEQVPVEVIEWIAGQRASGILFVCVRGEKTQGHGEECAFAVRRGVPVRAGHIPQAQVHVGEWKPVSEAKLELAGASIDDLWDSLCAQTVLGSVDGTDLDRRIAVRARIVQLESDVDNLTRAHARAKQPAQRNELYAKLHKARTQLDQLRGSAA